MKKVLMLVLLSLALSCRPERLVQCEPREEVCNGIDDDCDGKIDEELYQACSTACGTGTEICVMGAWAYCSARQPSEEVCDGIDNDCNGAVDDGLPVKPCYPGDTNDLVNGECRFGIERCVAGRFQCIGAITPQPETCNGKDDNCDGVVDEGTDGGADIVFVVDCSGSMTDKLESLKSSTAAWVSKFSGRTDLNFALVGAPGPNVYQNSPDPNLIVPLGPPAPFVSAVGTLTAYGSGDEPTLDALWLLADPTDPLHVGWTPGFGKSIVLYTDEAPQSYRGHDMADVVIALQAAGIKITTFTILSAGWPAQFNPEPFLYGKLFDQELDKVIQNGRCH